MVSLITEMFIFTNLVLVLLMHTVFCHDLPIQQRLSQKGTRHLTEINNIKDNMAQFEETLAYLRSNCILKSDATHQVMIFSSVFRCLSLKRYNSIL